MKNFKSLSIAGKSYLSMIVSPVVLLLLTVVISGCGLLGKDTGPLPPIPGASPPPSPAPKEVVMDIYWDATISMQGFTRINAGNVYRTLPDTLGNMGSVMGEAHFFRFGEQVTPVEGREHRLFSTPDVYTELITSFGSVIDAADTEHLSVVVTDLFESEADWTLVTQKLREKYFSRHQTIAIIGVKNSFSGRVYDVGMDAASFDYDSGDEVARFRPFYLFLMGSHEKVRYFLNEWKRLNPVGEMEYVVFSEYLTAEPVTFRVADATAKKNIYEDRRLKKSDDRLQEIGIAKRDKIVELVVPAKIDLAPYVCLREDQLENLTPRVRIFELHEEDEKPEDGEKRAVWQEDADGWQREERNEGSHISLKEASEGEKEKGYSYALHLAFSPDRLLPKGRIGLLDVEIVPARENLSLPDWISAWDMGNIDAQIDELDGSKTANLKRIAESLKSSLLVSSNPTIARLDIVVDGR